MEWGLDHCTYQNVNLNTIDEEHVTTDLSTGGNVFVFGKACTYYLPASSRRRSGSTAIVRDVYGVTVVTLHTDVKAL